MCLFPCELSSAVLTSHRINAKALSPNKVASLICFFNLLWLNIYASDEDLLYSPSTQMDWSVVCVKQGYQHQEEEDFTIVKLLPDFFGSFMVICFKSSAPRVWVTLKLAPELLLNQFPVFCSGGADQIVFLELSKDNSDKLTYGGSVIQPVIL